MDTSYSAGASARRFSLVAFFAGALLGCGLPVKAQQSLTERLRAHVEYLADDRLEGRETGTAGERLALEYIVEAFRKMGLQPAGTEGYQQAFQFVKGKSASPNSTLEIGGVALQAGTEFYPLPEGGEGQGQGPLRFGAYGLDDSLRRAFLPEGFARNQVLLLDLSVPGGYKPHSALGQLADVRTRIEAAYASGASALVLFSRDAALPPPQASQSMRITEASIPVFWLSPAGYERVFGQQEPEQKAWGQSVSYRLAWDRDLRSGHNALALLDNPGTERLVVIGAHYDHLGYGGSGSLYTGGPAIHNGADDNASGVAGVLEIARGLLQGPAGSDYLFIAFSGEEMGLYGSKHYVKSELFDSLKVAYMVNLDMIGRLNPTERKLVIDGASSSPAFSVVERLQRDSVVILPGGSSMGSSDHMSFALEGIPSLHFFTGTHADYHKPSDDADKVNYEGIASVVGLVLDLVDSLDDAGKLAYVRQERSSEPAPSFKVTLGVIPDYLFEGRGMRIESVREGRPAFEAGIQAGDVVLRIGEVEVLDMMSYMKALGRFSAGQTTPVVVLRGEEELSLPVTF
jgi:aminopeptidase YwaD